MTMALFILLILVATGFVALNVVAYNNARQMTRFLPLGAMPRCPDSSSVIGRIRFLISGPRIPRPVNTATPADHDLPFDTAFVTTADGLQLELWDIPAQTPRGSVTMFHGYGGQKEAMLEDAQCFHDLDLNVVIVDFRGSGGSDGNITTIGIAEAHDVIATVSWAKTRYPEGRMILFGVSMGAVAILRAVKHHALRPEAVIMLCPFERLVTTVAHRFEELGAPPFPSAHLLTFWGGLQCGFNGFRHNPVDDAAALTSPCLLLHASCDPRVSVAEVRRVHGALRGPRQLYIFEGLTHESYIQARPEEYRRVVAQWIEGLT